MREYFEDWRTKTVDIKQNTSGVDPVTGVPTETPTTVSENVEVNFWTDSATVSNQNDKFVGQTVGRAILPETLTITDTMWMEESGVKYFITGTNNVAGLGEVLVVSWRRERG